MCCWRLDNDTLYGRDGADQLDGGDGNDSSTAVTERSALGGAGNDRLYGENDADQLDGGLGNDMLDGGAAMMCC